LSARLTRDPARVEVKGERAAPVAIEQRVHFADDHSHKHRLLDHLLADVAMTQSIVFIATKRDAESLAQRLQGEGHAAAALHGDMDQRQRTRTLQDMRRGHVRTLVATDVAARGIDVAGISHVINFDLPRQAEDYVHRIGRTGRAGAAGIAVSLANHAERGALRQIERFISRDRRARDRSSRAGATNGRREADLARSAAPAPATPGRRRAGRIAGVIDGGRRDWNGRNAAPGPRNGDYAKKGDRAR
jgi:superfamily II DNA/RNA helicase